MVDATRAMLDEVYRHSPTLIALVVKLQRIPFARARSDHTEGFPVTLRVSAW